MDIVLMIDLCPKTGKAAFAAQTTAANLFVDSFQGKGVTAVPNFAVISYCGPRTWSGVSKCGGKGPGKVDIEKACHTKVVSHFTDDLKKVKTILNGIEYAPGLLEVLG